MPRYPLARRSGGNALPLILVAGVGGAAAYRFYFKRYLFEVGSQVKTGTATYYVRDRMMFGWPTGGVIGPTGAIMEPTLMNKYVDNKYLVTATTTEDPNLNGSWYLESALTAATV